MGTALQTQNPRVSDVLASILHEAPVGLWSCQKSAMDERNERERERYTSVRKIHAMRERRIETGIYIRGTYLVMGQCASVTIRYCVRAHCSWLFFLRAWHVPRWHPWVLGSFAYLPSHAEDRRRGKKSRISNPFDIVSKIRSRLAFEKNLFFFRGKKVAGSLPRVNPSNVDYRMTREDNKFCKWIKHPPAPTLLNYRRSILAKPAQQRLDLDF